MLYQKILVALDESATATPVFQQALDLAKLMGAELMLLHVLSADERNHPGLPTFPHIYHHPGLADWPLESYQQAWRTYESQGLERLKDFAREAQNQGVRVTYQQQSGQPTQMICDLAGDFEADLIVMGCRGRAGLSELLLGSVSNGVMHHAPCTVMVLRAFDRQGLESVVQDHPEKMLAHLPGWQ